MKASPKNTVAVATYRDAPAINADDLPVFESFRDRTGWDFEAAAWNDPAVDWGRFQAVVIRSTWGYYRTPEAFHAWIGAVEASGARLWNPPAVLRWNADKRYLRELEAAGVPIVPTEFLARGASADLSEILARRGWSEVVVKPAVSASADRTWTAAAAEAAERQADFAAALAEADLLVQPFLPEIRTAGEWSLIFFAGAGGGMDLSHWVVKRPKDGDFRVQNELGGSIHTPPLALGLAEAALETLAAAERVVGDPVLYARVDGVISEGRYAPAGRFLLMELELIEPSLYLGHGEGAPDRFAEAMVARLGV